MTISDIIGAVPSLLLYFVPGFVALFLYRKLRGDERDSSFTVLISCCVSYIGVAGVRALMSAVGISIASVYLEALIITAILSACMIGVVKIMDTGRYRKILYSLFRLSPKKDAWYNAIDTKSGTAALVKLKNTDYWLYGTIASFGDVTKNRWIALWFVRRYKADTHDEIDAYEDDDEIVLICIDDIEMIKFIPIKKESDKGK